MGLGEGVSKQGALPVIESDYILANIAEELGLIGVLVVVGLLFSLIVIIYQRAAASTELYRKSVLIGVASRSEEHTSELQSRFDLVCRLLLEKKKHIPNN